MGKAKKNNRSKALKKYWKILAIVRKEYAKNKIKVTIKELREDTSAIYPTFREVPSNKISREKVLTASKAPTQPKPEQPKKQQPLAQPVVDSELLEPTPYYDAAKSYPLGIDKSGDNVLFISRITPEGINELQGGEVYDYDTYFKDFVTYCNLLMKEASKSGLKADSGDAPLVVTIPIKDKNGNHLFKEGKWLYQIVSGKSGFYGEFVPDDFGFDLSEPLVVKGKLDVRSEEPQQIEEPSLEEQSSKQEAITGFDMIRLQAEKEERIAKEKIQSEERLKIEKLKSEERIKTKKLNDLKELLVSKVINLDEYLKAINEIK